MNNTTLIAAQQKDAVFQASLDFIGTLTGLKPPPIEVAPPEVFAPFREFAERVCAIFEPGATAAPTPAGAAPTGELTDKEITDILLSHGYTIKPGETGLRRYVIDGARALLTADAAMPARLTTERDAVMAEHDALSKDAARYRWLRQKGRPYDDGEDFGEAGTISLLFMTTSRGHGTSIEEDEMDSAIDAAMAKAVNP